MNVLSLFDGMSCGQIALQRVGVPYTHYYASEIDIWCIKVTQHNFPRTIQLGDVRALSNLPEPIDLLIGGSPCQGFSMLQGKRLDFNDPRSKLFFEYVRLLKVLYPRWFLLENVRMKQPYIDIISSYLECNPVLIDSAQLTVAHRPRLYWTNIPINPILDLGITFDDINTNAQTWLPQTVVNKIKAWKSQAQPTDKNRSIRIGAHQKVLTLTARGFDQYHSGMKLVTDDGVRFRYLTIEEGERAMTVPVGYTALAPKNQRSRMLGNGWSVDVIAHIFKGLREEH